MKKIILQCIMLLFMRFVTAQSITAYEYWLNNDYVSKTHIAITPSKDFYLNQSIQLSGVKSGLQTFNIRFEDNNHMFSSTITELVYGFCQSSSITQYEYWFDFDFKNSVKISISNPTEQFMLQASINAGNVSNGMHILNIRFGNAAGIWSSTLSSFFMKTGSSASVINQITSYRYWTDKNFAKKITVHLKTPSTDFYLNDLLDQSLYTSNDNFLYFQFRDTLGQWSVPVAMQLGPYAQFESINISNTDSFVVNFTNKSIYANAYLWDFGDKTSSTQSNPTHRYKDPGAYKTTLIAKNSIGSDTISSYVYIRGLARIYPQSGGNTGDVTLTAFGGKFVPGTTFILKKTGEPDISGDSVYLPYPGAITSTFDLRNKATGKYNVVVSIPNDTVMTLPNAFEILTGETADPWVSISGRETILINRWIDYTLTYGNNSNVDASGVPIWIAVTDDPNVKFNLGDIKVVHSGYVIDSGLVSSYDTIPIFFKTDSLFGSPEKSLVYPLYIPIIPAKSSYTATIKVMVKTSMNVNLQAWVTNPLFQSPYNADAAACILSVIGEGVVDIGTSAIPAVGCLGSVGKLVYNPWNNYRDPATNTWGSWLWNSAVTFVDCGINLSGAGNIAKGIGVFIANFKGYYDTMKDCMDAYKSNGKSKTKIKGVSSMDPNEKAGPSGFTTQNYISKNKAFPYTIYFENKDTATAPAHEVFITDTLDISKFNLRSFSLGPICFGDTCITPFPGQKEFTKDINMNPKLNFITRINAKLDTISGIVKWEFISLDPINMSQTNDVILGFLPPNKVSPEGEGKVSFTVNLKPGISNNDVVKNSASILFDTNAPIVTNECSNIIDFEKPSSYVLPLPAKTKDSLFTVSWRGTDNGSGISMYNIYVLINDTGFVAWKSNTTDTSDIFKSKKNWKYKFYSIATDQTGNIEDSTGFDAETFVTVGLSEDEINNENQIRIIPNPVQNTMYIQYNLTKPSQVAVSIYNYTGIKLMELTREKQTSGMHEISSNFQSLASGIYFVEIKINSVSTLKKIFVIH